MSKNDTIPPKDLRWNAWRLTIISIIALNVLIVLILLLVYSDYLSEFQKIMGLVGAAVPALLNWFRIKKGRKIPLVEFISQPHVIASTSVFTIIIWVFFALAILPIHNVIVSVDVDNKIEYREQVLNSLTISWNGKHLEPVGDPGEYVIKSVRMGSYLLKYEAVGFTRPESNIVNVELFPVTDKATYSVKAGNLLVSNVYFRTNPPGAEIIINGESQHVLTNDYVPLPAGDHHYRLVLGGHRPVEGKISVRHGDKKAVVEGLDMRKGSINIQDDSHAAIFLNDCWTGEYSPRVLLRPVGEYRVVLQLKNATDFGRRWDTTIVVGDRQPVNIARKLGPQDNGKLYPLMIVSDPQADVIVWGKKEGLTNRQPLYLFRGDYSVILERRGYHSERLPVRIPGSQYLDTIPLMKLQE